MKLHPHEYLRMRELVHARFGIDLTTDKLTLIVNRLHRYLSERGFTSYSEFLDAVEGDPTSASLDDLANLISTNHTYFFREPAHFDFLATRALPDVDRLYLRGDSNDLRVWCAAAATGQEAYSIAMVMREYFGLRYAELDAGLLATDISRKALLIASAGKYTPQQAQSAPESMRARYLRQREDGDYEVAPFLREDVLVRKFNLTAPAYPFKRPFHIIFCRNVMIYFDPETRRHVARQLYAFTAPGGYLFTGHSESLDRETTDFEYIQPAVYRRPLPNHP